MQVQVCIYLLQGYQTSCPRGDLWQPHVPGVAPFNRIKEALRRPLLNLRGLYLEIILTPRLGFFVVPHRGKGKICTEEGETWAEEEGGSVDCEKMFFRKFA